MKLKSLLLSLSICLLMAGCKSKPVGVTQLPGGGRTDTTATSPPPVMEEASPVDPNARDLTSENLGEGEMKDRVDWIVDNEVFKDQTIYFDLDESTVKASELPKLEAVVAKMRAHPGKAVRIAGHCDERGTEEYNRSLGERRALAIREALGRLGLSQDLIDTISFGEDRPVDPGHSQEAWAKNRRGEIGMLSPPLRSDLGVID